MFNRRWPQGLACHSPSRCATRSLHRQLQSKAATCENDHCALQRTDRNLVQSNHVPFLIAERIVPRPLCLRVGKNRRENEDVQASLKQSEGDKLRRQKENPIQLHEEVQSDRRYPRPQQVRQHPSRLRDLRTHHRKLALKVQALTVSSSNLVMHLLLVGA